VRIGDRTMKPRTPLRRHAVTRDVAERGTHRMGVLP
jgi:hypothetical protein